MTINSVLNITCSKATNKESLPVDCNLLDELMSNKYQQQQNEVRAESDKVKQNELKMKMPVLLPSGTFKGAKAAKNLVKHSGVIAIDIDFKDNEHITNFKDFKSEIRNIQNVAYCGLSVRGKGYFLIIPIAYPEKHNLHFKYIESYFKKRGLVIDQTCINVNRLRYYSYDNEAYYNHAARPLQAYFRQTEPKAIQHYQKRNKGSQLAGNVYDNATEWVLNKGVQFIEGKKHEYIYLLSYYLVSNGVKKSDAESWIDSNLIKLTEITSNCIDYPFANYTVGKEIEVQSASKPQSTSAIVEQLVKPLATQQSIKVAPAIHKQSLTKNDSLEQLQAMATASYQLTMVRNKETFKPTYLKLWAKDMGNVLLDAGITQHQFLNSFL